MKKVLSIIVSLMLIVSPVYALDSEGVIYDNSTSGSSATNVESALNDLYSKLNEKQTEINNIKNIGNATADKILSGYTAYVKGNTITGSIPSKGATTYTPGTSNQTIASGQYLSGAQTIKGDANLVAANIAKGKSIFGISGTYTSDANAVAGNILSGKTAYVNGSKITGSMPSRSDSGNVAQDKAWLYSNRVYFGVETGYYPSANYGGMTGVSERYITYESLAKIIGLTADKLITGNTILGITGSIPSKGAATYTPGRSNQTIASGQYLSGAQTIKGDANLVAANIAKGKSIFGISGTYTSDANAVAGNILSGKTAYVNGSKITGTMRNWIGTPQHIDAIRIANNRFEVAVAAGYHGYSWAGNSYEYMEYSQVASAIGLTADKLVSGQTVLGITGTGGGYKAYKFEKVKASVSSDKTFNGSWKNMMSKDGSSSFSIDLGFTPSEVVVCKAKLVGNYFTTGETSWGVNFRISRGYIEMTHTGQNYYMFDLPSDMNLSNSNSADNFSDIRTSCRVTGSRLVFTVSDSSNGTTTYVPVQTRATEFYLTGTLIYK